jgi:hypothetical protein
MDNQPTNQDILETINEFSTHVDKRFVRIEERIGSMEKTMVTKDYLDDKLADLRGDLVVLTRKEDAKLAATLNLLAQKHVISNEEAKTILAMEPFPKLSL